MNNKKYKPTIAIIIGLATLSGGMFYYQNVRLPKLQETKTESVYVANDDIKAYTELNPDMFTEVKINSNSVLDGYIKDINKVDGYKLKGNLLKGEALSSVRLTKEDLDGQGGLIVSMTPDSTSNVKEGDYVNVYVLLTDKITKESAVRLLFENKKVINPKAGIKDEISNAAKSETTVTISFSEDELKNYYLAKETGKIIVAKVGDLDTKVTSEESENIEKFDANSEEVKNAVKVETKSGESLSVVSYEVKDGDTLDSLSLKFKTDSDTIIELNDGKDEFNVGDRITVPAI